MIRRRRLRTTELVKEAVDLDGIRICTSRTHPSPNAPNRYMVGDLLERTRVAFVNPEEYFRNGRTNDSNFRHEFCVFHFLLHTYYIILYLPNEVQFLLRNKFKLFLRAV